MHTFETLKIALMNFHIPSNITSAILETIGSPDSYFYLHFVNGISSLLILIECNSAENYNSCHSFSYDLIGDDYQYVNLAVEQIKIIDQFINTLLLDD